MGITLTQLRAMELQAQSLEEQAAGIALAAGSLRRQVQAALSGGGWNGPDEDGSERVTREPVSAAAQLPPVTREGMSFLNGDTGQGGQRGEQGRKPGRGQHRRRASGGRV